MMNRCTDEHRCETGRVDDPVVGLLGRSFQRLRWLADEARLSIGYGDSPGS